VSRSVQRAVRLVHAFTDDLAIFDEDAANRRLVAYQSKLCLLPVSDWLRKSRAREEAGHHFDGLAHEALMIHFVFGVHDLQSRLGRATVILDDPQCWFWFGGVDWYSYSFACSRRRTGYRRLG
jgi:hypothetical protein